MFGKGHSGLRRTCFMLAAAAATSARRRVLYLPGSRWPEILGHLKGVNHKSKYLPIAAAARSAPTTSPASANHHPGLPCSPSRTS
jgi:hypothetical protein